MNLFPKENLFPKQKYTNKYRKEVYVYQRGKGGRIN